MIRLPDAEMVRDTEATIHADPGSYPLPTFYQPTFSTPNLPAAEQPFWNTVPKITATNCMFFHACLIGDYTIGQCG